MKSQSRATPPTALVVPGMVVQNVLNTVLSLAWAGEVDRGEEVAPRMTKLGVLVVIRGFFILTSWWEDLRRACDENPDEVVGEFVTL